MLSNHLNHIQKQKKRRFDEIFDYFCEVLQDNSSKSDTSRFSTSGMI